MEIFKILRGQAPSRYTSTYMNFLPPISRIWSNHNILLPSKYWVVGDTDSKDALSETYSPFWLFAILIDFHNSIRFLPSFLFPFFPSSSIIDFGRNSCRPPPKITWKNGHENGRINSWTEMRRSVCFVQIFETVIEVNSLILEIRARFFQALVWKSFGPHVSYVSAGLNVGIFLRGTNPIHSCSWNFKIIDFIERPIRKSTRMSILAELRLCIFARFSLL